MALASNKVFFDFYQECLDCSKNIFNNYNVEIALPKDFNQKFNNKNSRAFFIEKTMNITVPCCALCFLALFLVPILFIAIFGKKYLEYIGIKSNDIVLVQVCIIVCIVVIGVLFIFYPITRLVWRKILKDYDLLSNNVFKLIDEKVIDSCSFNKFNNAIMLLCKSNTHRLSDAVVFSSKTNEELINMYYQVLNSFYEKNIPINHNEIIKEIEHKLRFDNISKRIDYYLNLSGFSFSSSKSNIRKRRGYNLKEFYFLAAAICKNYLDAKQNNNQKQKQDL